MAMAVRHFLTLGDLARHFDCRVWQIRRLFERNLLPPAARIGVYRIVPVSDVPKVEMALRKAGYLKREVK